MPTRERVRELLDNGMDYAVAGRELGIPAGQAYMIPTGVPADSGDTTPDADDRGLLPSSQRLSNPPLHNERIAAEVRKHVAFEDLVFLKMREAMSREDLDRLGEKLLSAMKTAPTRPARRKGKGRSRGRDRGKNNGE